MRLSHIARLVSLVILVRHTTIYKYVVYCANGIQPGQTSASQQPRTGSSPTPGASPPSVASASGGLTADELKKALDKDNIKTNITKAVNNKFQVDGVKVEVSKPGDNKVELKLTKDNVTGKEGIAKVDVKDGGNKVEVEFKVTVHNDQNKNKEIADMVASSLGSRLGHRPASSGTGTRGAASTVNKPATGNKSNLEDRGYWN